MMRNELVATVRNMIGCTAAEKGLPAMPVAEDTVLLGSALGIDSLDLAAIVVQLSETTGQDPFQDGFIEFRTVGQLCDLYCASK
jgi:acyl carrier protein